MAKQRSCQQQPRHLVRSLLPLMLHWLLFADGVSAKGPGRDLQCYQCESTVNIGVNTEITNKKCSNLPVSKAYLVNRTDADPNGNWLKEEDSILCEVSLELLPNVDPLKPMVHLFNRRMRTVSLYKYWKFPLSMKAGGEKFRCFQEDDESDSLSFKKICFCAANACNDMVSFEQLRDMKMTETVKSFHGR